MSRTRNIPQLDTEDKHYQRLVHLLQQMVIERAGEGSTFEERQGARMALMSEVMWGAEEQDLKSLIEESEAVEVDGVVYRRLSQPSSTTYHGLWGPHLIEESLYRDTSCRAGPTIKPLAARVGIIDGAILPDAGRVMGLLMAHMTSREVHSTLQSMGLRPPSRAFIEKRLGRMGEQVALRIAELEAEARLVEGGCADRVAAVSCGIDRMSVRMSEPCSADRPPPSPRRTKPYKRRPPKPRELNWRMGWVGSVTLIGDDGEALRTVRFASDAGGDREHLVERVAREVEAVLKAWPGIPVLTIQDGAQDLQVLPKRLQRTCTSANSAFYPCLDFHHLMGYVDAVVRTCEPEGDPDNMRGFYRRKLLHEERASYHIYSSFKRMAETLDPKNKEGREALARAISYIGPRRRFMPYAKLRLMNCPIGSGATESTCALMQLRIKRPGMAWEVPGLQSVMALRTLVLSDRWESAWPSFAALHRHDVRAA